MKITSWDYIIDTPGVVTYASYYGIGYVYRYYTAPKDLLRVVKSSVGYAMLSVS